MVAQAVERRHSVQVGRVQISGQIHFFRLRIVQSTLARYQALSNKVYRMARALPSSFLFSNIIYHCKICQLQSRKNEKVQSKKRPSSKSIIAEVCNLSFIAGETKCERRRRGRFQQLTTFGSSGATSQQRFQRPCVEIPLERIYPYSSDF